MGVEGLKCVVTGGSGFTGQRLVEMLVERGAARVVSFDIAPKPPGASEHPAIEYLQVGLCPMPILSKESVILAGYILCPWSHGARALPTAGLARRGSMWEQIAHIPGTEITSFDHADDNALTIPISRCIPRGSSSL